MSKRQINLGKVWAKPSILDLERDITLLLDDGVMESRCLVGFMNVIGRRQSTHKSGVNEFLKQNGVI